jgi:uncharacterized protein YciI
MYFVITCYDKPDQTGLRQQTRTEHLEYLAGNEGNNKVIGPLLSADGQTPCGSLLIIEAENMAAAERFAKGDPYAKAGIFETVTIMPWRPAVGEWLPASLHI